VIESSLATLRTASSIPASGRSEDDPRRPGGMAQLSLLSRADRGLPQPIRRLSDGACDLLDGLRTRVFVAGCGPSLRESVIARGHHRDGGRRPSQIFARPSLSRASAKRTTIPTMRLYCTPAANNTLKKPMLSPTWRGFCESAIADKVMSARIGRLRPVQVVRLRLLPSGCQGCDSQMM
jgi:hypothetical protein